MKAHQFTVAYNKPININELVTLLQKHYGTDIEIGQGLATNGIPHDWIVVHNERKRRLD